MDDKTFWQVVSTLVGTCVGFFGVLVGALLAHLFTQRRADREYRLRMLIEVLDLMTFVSRYDFKDYKALYQAVKTRRISQSDAARLVEEAADEQATKVVDICTLLFPELAGAMTYWRESGLAFCSKKGNAVNETQESLEAALHVLMNADGELRNKIVNLGAQIRAGSVLNWLNSLRNA